MSYIFETICVTLYKRSVFISVGDKITILLGILAN